MAAYVKYQDAADQLFRGIHHFHAAGDTFKVVIHSDAPVVASDDELADLTQITGTGYTAGGEDVQNDMSETGGVATVTAVDVTWTATAANWVAGRYISTYNDTSTGDKLWNNWDYGANFTLGNGETFTVDFGSAWHTGT